MRSITDRLTSINDRLLPSSSADKREGKLERARKRAAAEAQRREHQREDMGSKIHRKGAPGLLRSAPAANPGGASRDGTGVEHCSFESIYPLRGGAGAHQCGSQGSWRARS